MTKTAFLEAYRAALLRLYPWAQNPARLDKFMTSVESTVHGTAATWDHKGEAVTTAWRAIGGKGTPTLKALRTLKD